MKFIDLLSMATASLWQQRGRTALTLISLHVGALILFFSLAARQGVQQAVVRVFSESDQLRRIEIWPAYYPPEDEVPAHEVEPQGNLTEAKRQRLRKLLVRKWQLDHQSERTGITPDRLRQLEGLPNVEKVIPAVQTWCWVVLGGDELEVEVTGVPADNKVLRERIVAGNPLSSDTDRGVLIHEFLAYQWGAVDSDQMQSLVGKNVRLEVRYRAEAVANTLAFRSGRETELTQDEIKSLNRALDRIPLLIDQLPLPDDEKQVMAKVFPSTAADDQAPQDRIISEEFVVRGIFRGPTPEEEDKGLNVGQFHRDASVVIPIGTATKLYFERLDTDSYGLRHATVMVDDHRKLKEVSERLRELGYSDHSLLGLVETIHEYISIVTAVCAAVAGVALFVAAVGIMNTMIMSVVERTFEIGVMKSIGASDRQVLLIFLFEGAVVGILGALLSIAWGLVISLGIDKAIRAILEKELYRSFDQGQVLVFEWWMIAAVVGVACLVTVLAAILPAYRAARISPVTALRHE